MGTTAGATAGAGPAGRGASLSRGLITFTETPAAALAATAARAGAEIAGRGASSVALPILSLSNSSARAKNSSREIFPVSKSARIER